VDEIHFLTLDELLQIHDDQLERYGGLAGFISRDIVESALAQPGAMAFGQYLHADIADMAAAYVFHFASSQGFVDGNKRTATLAAVMFLLRNGYRLDVLDEDLYPIVLRVATGSFSKSELSDWLRPRLSPMR
jgi:death-on-curing protein